MKTSFLIFMLLLVGCSGDKANYPKPPIIVSCEAGIEWSAPGFRMDGSDLLPEDIEKFTIYVSEDPDPQAQMISLVIEVDDPAAVSWTIYDLGLREHWFWVTVTETGGLESAPSNVEGKDCQGQV